jgi:hypothetical protein
VAETVASIAPYGDLRAKLDDSCEAQDKNGGAQPATGPPPATPVPQSVQKEYPTAIGRNILRLCEDCGWSLKDLAKAAETDERNVTRHTSGGKNPGRASLERYAEVFSEKLGRPITLKDLKT